MSLGLSKNSDLWFSSKDFSFLSMEDSEKNRYIEFLIQQKEERDRTIADKDAFIKNLQDTLDMLKSMHGTEALDNNVLQVFV